MNHAGKQATTESRFAMSTSYDAVKAQLLDVEVRAFELYELVNKSKLRGLAGSSRSPAASMLDGSGTDAYT